MKKSKTCSYFDGEMTDGKSCIRVFGFDAGVRKKLAFYEENKEAVTISKCEVKNSRRGKDLEVLVTKNTDLSTSDQHFDLDTSSSAVSKGMGTTIELSELQDKEKYQCVNMKVKAIREEEIEEVPGGKKIQNIIIADKTATARLTVWEAEIGKIEAGKSYDLTGLVVREFRGRKFLSTSKDKSNIVDAEDIGEVADETAGDNSPTNMTNPSYSWVHNIRVIGVMNLDKYNCCINCSTKLVPDAEDLDLGHCSKCQMVQCLESANKGLMAKLMLASGGDKHTLSAFGKIVENIADKPADEISITTLLKAKPFKIIHVDGIIQSVSRKP